MGKCYFFEYTLLTLTDRTPIPTLSDRGGEALRAPPSISAPVADRDVKFFSGGSCVFLEKITFSSHSGQTAPSPLFSGQPLNIKTAVERPILKLG